MYSVPRNSSRAAFVQAAALRVIQDAHLQVPPVPVEQLITDRGLAITGGKIPNGWGYFDAGAWVIRLSNAILVDTAATRNRRRFTLAHELGHCVLEHGEQSCWNLSTIAEPSEVDELDDLPNFEQEAHMFARELLLPREWFRRDWLDSPDANRWSQIYGVSRETLFIVVTERRLLMTRRKPHR